MHQLLEKIKNSGVEVVSHLADSRDISEIQQFLASAENIEGFVITFKNGHRIKVKGAWYVQIHKAKDAILKERNVVDMIINEKLDDVMAMLPEEDRVELVKYQTRLLSAMEKTVDELFDRVISQQKIFATNKDYALSEEKKSHKRFTQRVIFQFLERHEMDSESLYQAIRDFYIKGLVRVNLNNDTKFREMKQEAFPNVRFIQNQMMN